jgi:uncharacterized membrane-anchored protein YhcB (DUF1043 family)
LFSEVYHLSSANITSLADTNSSGQLGLNSYVAMFVAIIAVFVYSFLMNNSQFKLSKQQIEAHFSLSALVDSLRTSISDLHKVMDLMARSQLKMTEKLEKCVEDLEAQGELNELFASNVEALTEKITALQEEINLLKSQKGEATPNLPEPDVLPLNNSVSPDMSVG